MMARSVNICKISPLSATTAATEKRMKQWITAFILLLASSPAFAAEFKWTDESGKMFSLAEMQGEPVVVHLWASWCPACRTEMKDFANWMEKNPALKVVMVSLDQRSEDAASFLKEKEINRPVLLSDETQARKLGVRALPSTIIVAADGSISQLHRGPRNWSDEQFSQQVLSGLHP